MLPSRKCRGVAELSILGAVIASQLVVGYAEACGLRVKREETVYGVREAW